MQCAVIGAGDSVCYDQEGWGMGVSDAVCCDWAEGKGGCTCSNVEPILPITKTVDIQILVMCCSTINYYCVQDPHPHSLLFPS